VAESVCRYWIKYVSYPRLGHDKTIFVWLLAEMTRFVMARVLRLEHKSAVNATIPNFQNVFFMVSFSDFQAFFTSPTKNCKTNLENWTWA
jgi:hypothetical protein